MKKILFIVLLFSVFTASSQENIHEKMPVEIKTNLPFLAFGTPNVVIEQTDQEFGYGASFYYSLGRLRPDRGKNSNRLNFFVRYYPSKKGNTKGLLTEISLGMINFDKPLIPSFSLGYKSVNSSKLTFEVFYGVGIIDSKLLLGSRAGISLGRSF